jgi:hypothetical protein
MNRELKAILLVSVIIGLPLLSCSAVLGNSNNSIEALQDQILYFQSTEADYLRWLMNTSMPSGQGISEPTTPNNLAFVSPPLVQEFTYQTVTATIYHEEVPSDRGTFTLWVTLGFIDTSGNRHPVKWNTKSLASGSTVDSVSINLDTKLLEGERLLAEILVMNTLSLWLNICWGNSTHSSQVSYEGTAVYVPEFPSFLVLPLFMITTLLAVIFFRRKHSV